MGLDISKLANGCDHRQGAQGQLDTASKSTLENEFGTTKEDDIIAIILEKGDIQEVEVSYIYSFLFSRHIYHPRDLEYNLVTRP
jgi:hypothetical protein